jgi:uncharacterized membrane protein YjjP (DUF1212 family)
MSEPRRDEKDEKKQDEKEEEKRGEKEEKSREEKWRRDPLSAIAWAAILIWAGVVFLVDSLQLLGRWEIPIWAVIFIGAGVIVLVEALARVALPEYRQGVTSSLIGGIVFIAIGLGFLVGWQVVWPIVLIAIGIAILLGGLLWRK